LGVGLLSKRAAARPRRGVAPGRSAEVRDDQFAAGSSSAEERADAEARAKAIVIATTHYKDPKVLAEVSEQVPSAMKGLAVSSIPEAEMLQTRGW